MSKHYLVKQRERAVKTVLDHLDEYRSVRLAPEMRQTCPVKPWIGVRQ